jgi:hypothetical protein
VLGALNARTVHQRAAQAQADGKLTPCLKFGNLLP